MNLRPIYAIACIFFLQSSSLSAQDKLSIKFGKITPADFDLSKQKYDSGAAAVVIADIGKTYFEGNAKGDFSLVFSRFRRVKIINKNGYDAASDEILVYKNGIYGENLAELKASTFNLENGNVVEAKLDQKSVFTDKLDRYYSNKKFTMPAVKEGSIVDISYTVKSDYYNFLRPWNFQGDYPCLWSEYEVIIPQFFHYVFLAQGDQHFFIKTSKDVGASYTVRESGGTESDDVYHIMSNAIDSRWVKTGVPAMKEENYTSTIKNYVSRIEFQLHYVQYTETSERHEKMSNYFVASEKLLKDESFGAALENDNSWMNTELKTITAGCNSPGEKMKKIYAYIRDHFTCTDHSSMYMDNPIKSVFKTKNGNIAEINLLLIAMLRHENIQADPVILGTRNHRRVDEVYPLMERFNYVICLVSDSGRSYLLDASWPKLGFGKLDQQCYNGGARQINKDHPYVVNLSADSVKEQKVTSVLIANDEKIIGTLNGAYSSILGNVESYSLRKKLAGKTYDAFFKERQSSSADYKISNPGIDSLANLDMPLTIHYDFQYKMPGDEDIIYFNPMMSEAYKENPFKAAERKYPVEMPYTTDETYILNMEIPNGYTVEEIPKSAKVLFNETEGFFEYLILKDDNNIQFRSRVKLNKANFQPEDYNTLRDFFAYVVKKQSEQIVFKKKK
jgi:transglutaminase superfamily protein/uncharacterized protein DUF3858